MVEVLQRASQFATTHADGRKDSPSLHSLASLYLTGALRHIFNVSAMVHFVSLLIGYVLAWSKAFCQVCFAYNFQTHIALFQSSATEIQIVGCTDSVVITPFVIVFSTALVLLNRQLQPLVTTLTFIKVWKLVLMALIVWFDFVCSLCLSWYEKPAFFFPSYILHWYRFNSVSCWLSWLWSLATSEVKQR